MPEFDPRHIARALALQTLYNQENQNTSTEVDVQDLLAELQATKYDEELYNKIVIGVTEHKEKIHKIITKLAPTWPITELFNIDRIILTMAIWEGFIQPNNPKKAPIIAIIDQAIELGKKFGGTNSGSFINGVLATLQSSPELQSELQN